MKTWPIPSPVEAWPSHGKSWSVERIRRFAEHYVETAENPSIKEFQAQARKEGLRGHREELRQEYRKAHERKYGQKPERGRRRKIANKSAEI